MGAGVGSGAAAVGSAAGAFEDSGSAAGALEDSGSTCGVWGSAGFGAGFGAGAAAAPGLRRAALGANFLPEVLLLMKELNVAGACALSAPCAGCGVELSSAMVAVCCVVQLPFAMSASEG